MKRKNLIFLILTNGNTRLVKICPKGVCLDLEKKTWIFHEEERKIGESRLIPSYVDDSVIGVYNKNQIRHLNSMIYAVREEATKLPSYNMD